MPIMQTVIQGGGTAPAYYIEKTVDANGKLENTTYIINLDGVTDIGDYAMYNAYAYNSKINGAITFNDIKKITGNSGMSQAFVYNDGITSLSMNSLEIASGNFCLYQFASYCRYITLLDLGSLTVLKSNSGNIAYDLVSDCTRLTEVKLSSLKVIDASGALVYAFMRDTALTSLSFPALTSTSFGSSYTNQFSEMLSDVTGCTIHFPSNLDPQSGSTVISSLTGYPNFGGTNTVLAFDLPATNLLTGANSQVYERNPKYDTATALAWRKQDTGTVPNLVIDWTPFYTNTLNDPQVNDTIYSDSACTTAVTTISSIS